MIRILIDVDGVLADFVASYLDLVEQVTGKRRTHEEIREFNIPRALGLSDEHAAEVSARVGYVGFCKDFAPLPGAIDGVARLQRIADVYIVTSPWNSNPTWCHDHEKWLARHFGIHHSKVIHTSAKELVTGDVLIDDRWDTCCKWRDAHPGKSVFMWESPWNRTCEWAGVLTNDWDRAVRLVEALS